MYVSGGGLNLSGSEPGISGNGEEEVLPIGHGGLRNGEGFHMGIPYLESKRMPVPIAGWRAIQAKKIHGRDTT